VAYRADIEIAVKGAQELKRLQDRIRNVSTTVDNFNSKIENIGGGYIVRNINNLTSLLGQAAAEFNKVALGTEDATAAARVYIAANDQLNAGLAERVALLKSVNEQARQARLAEGNKRFGGPRIVETSNAYGGQIGPGPASPVALRSNLGNRIENAVKAQNQAVIDASTNLRVKQSWNKFFRDAAALGTDLQVNAAAQKLNIKTSWNKFFKDAAAPIGSAPVKSKGGIGKGIGGALSNAAIGGAFPLLFGQSGAAAAGGALGGIAGSLLGPSGGFAGSLVGTILGEKVGQGNQIKQLGEDIGFSAEQTKMLGIAFQQAGRDFDKFQQSVSTIQGLSLSIEDQGRAIQLASSLTESYKGKIDKVTNAFANALSTGKVTQGTLNQLTGQGIPIQQALADKYGVSRDAILKMAKDGKISVQDLIDTLVEVGNKGQASATKQVDAFSSAYAQIEPIVGRLKTLFEGLFKFISDQLSNTLTEVLSVLSNIITGVETLVAYVGPAFETIAKTINNSFGKIQVPTWLASFMRQSATSQILPLLPGGPALALFNQVGKDTNTNAGMYGKYIPGSQQQPIKPQLQSLTAPSQAAPSGGTKDTAADKAAKAAEREAERVANIVRDRAAATEQLRLQMQYAHGIFVAETGKNPLLKLELEFQQQIGEISVDYSKQINDEKAKGNSAAAKAAITAHSLAKTEVAQLDYAMKRKKLEFERKENYDNLLMDLDQEVKLRSATTEEARNQLRIAYEMAKLEQTKMYSSDQLAAIQNRKQQIAAPKTPYETVSLAAGGITDELTKLLDTGNQVVTIADAIGNSFSNSFKGVISGSMTAREALAGFFQSVADAFLDMAAQIISKWIQMTILNSVLSLFPGGGGLAKSGGAGFDMGPLNNVGMSTFNPANSFPGLSGRASGGAVSAGTPYMVGEKGPELFMPGRSGTIVPNNALGGGSTNVVVNVDASGSNVQGDQTQAKQLGVAVSAAVQAELIKQQRPGGLLAGTRR
jgi:tape measure domain-containing protein